MANRGFFTKKGDTTNLVGRVGQNTSGLPTGNQESAVFQVLSIEDRNGTSFAVPIFGLFSLNQPRDIRADKSSFQINQPYGFIGTNQPYSFNIEGGGGGGVTTYYKMRGYYVVGAVYETYVVINDPNTPPPSGHTLIDIAIVSTWQV